LIGMSLASFTGLCLHSIPLFVLGKRWCPLFNASTGVEKLMELFAIDRILTSMFERYIAETLNAGWRMRPQSQHMAFFPSAGSRVKLQG
jgi:hypothetical protein